MLAHGTWLSAKEIADLGLPGLPADKRKVSELIANERWATRTGADGKLLHRERRGRGGGFEWHSSLLPERARTELVRRGIIAAPIADTSNVVAMPMPKAAPGAASAAAWAAFERMGAKAQAEAARRLAVIQEVEAHVASGLTKTRGIEMVSTDKDISRTTINNWFALIAGVARPDRLAHLALEKKGGGKTAEIDPQLWQIYKSDWLRHEGPPTHASCYWRLQRKAKELGLTLPSAKTLQRKAEREIPPEVILACRHGRDRVAQIVPAQIRTTAHLHAMHSVNIDGHLWDVMVRFPDGEVMRPMTVGIQDLYSRKILAWRTDKSENSVMVRLAFADLFKNHGIPRRCYMDNGRSFAGKWISGGVKTRFRFKVKEDEPLGLLPLLGIETHFVLPYSGQSKPIERAWKDFCDFIAKSPEFAGAYTGNSPVAKPENYGSRAIPLATFEQVIAREIAALNAKMGRRGGNCNGRSFDQTFAASIAAGAPVGRATEEQMRLALLAADRVFSDRKSGAISFAGNTYWSEGMLQYAGQRLTIRFDPDNLHSSVFAYDAKGALIAELPIWEASGFDDMAAAKVHAKRKSDLRKAVKATVEAERLLVGDELARALSGLSEPEPDMPAPTVIRPVRPARTGRTAAAQAPDYLDRFADAMTAATPNSAGLRLVE
jgi:transposase InsO family protein